MSKPKAIRWLDEQTGQTIDYPTEPAAAQDRHLSVRVTDDVADGLDRLAAGRGLTMSQLLRELLREAVEQRASIATLDSSALAERLAADVAEVRRRRAG